jgi:hypothetical protein
MAVHPAAAARLAGGIFRRQRFIHRLSGRIQGTALTKYGISKFKDTKANCRHLKKNYLVKVFIRVYRLEIQSFMLAFSTQLCELLPL